VAARLAADSVLVEFAKIRDYDWGRNRWGRTERYLAFVLLPDGKIVLVDLGDAQRLEDKITPVLRALNTPNARGLSVVGPEASTAPLDVGQHLHELVWKPLAPHVGRAHHLIIAPDGLINLVPFAPIRIPGGNYLVEKRLIRYVTSGRDLLKKTSPDTPLENDLFLAANPDFDLAGGLPTAPATGEPNLRSRDFVARFERLPGTAREADVIPALLGGGQKQVVKGARATEEAVLAAGRSRVLHLATHGFFLKDQETEPVQGQGQTVAPSNLDGVLTALEVTTMDLVGTDLVTLSACQTAVGDVRPGEGVFGLRRAFALAGAKHLMMSLWRVGDEITASQMEIFYRHYGQGLPPAKALRQAQLETLAQLRAQRAEPDPALWAPFILQGAPDGDLSHRLK
jgi:CHAT domain-containing protein